MTDLEKQEISKLPAQYRPLGAWSYFWYSILFAIPLIGTICLIVFALDSSNICRRSYARSFFCTFIIIAIVVVVILGLTSFNIGVLISYFENYFSSAELIIA